MFQAATYQNRRAQLQSSVNSGLLLFMGNGESPMNYTDNVYHFRQDSNFLYFFGIDRPDLAAIIDIDENKTIVFGNDLSLDHIVWMGPQPTIAEEAEKCGVSQTAAYNDLAAYLSKALASGRTIHYLPPYRAANKIKMSNWLKQPIEAIEQGASVDFIKASSTIGFNKRC